MDKIVIDQLAEFDGQLDKRFISKVKEQIDGMKSLLISSQEDFHGKILSGLVNTSEAGGFRTFQWLMHIQEDMLEDIKKKIALAQEWIDRTAKIRQTK